LAAKEHNNTTMTKQHSRSDINDDGDDGNGGDSGDDGDGDGNGDNATLLPTEMMLMTTKAVF
jgi:hypothetical protein